MKLSGCLKDVPVLELTVPEWYDCTIVHAYGTTIAYPLSHEKQRSRERQQDQEKLVECSKDGNASSEEDSTH